MHCGKQRASDVLQVRTRMKRAQHCAKFAQVEDTALKAQQPFNCVQAGRSPAPLDFTREAVVCRCYPAFGAPQVVPCRSHARRVGLFVRVLLST